jgi:hypothetical protein
MRMVRYYITGRFKLFIYYVSTIEATYELRDTIL